MIAPMNGTPAPREDKALKIAQEFYARMGAGEAASLWGEVRVTVHLEAGKIKHVRWEDVETQLIR